jgi:hypothetical protein
VDPLNYKVSFAQVGGLSIIIESAIKSVQILLHVIIEIREYKMVEKFNMTAIREIAIKR